MPELRQLRVFVAVAEQRNFTRAAAGLHLAQQTVSKAVRRLERELGVELLERTTREVRLTAAGAALLDSGRDVLAAADAAFERARAVGGGLAGTVRVGASPAVGAGTLRDVVGALRDGAPALGVSVREVRPADVRRALHDGEVDVVLARTLRAADDVHTAPLRPTTLVVAVPAAHPLACERSVELSRLDGERLLVWSARGTPYTDLLVALTTAAGARVKVVESRVVGALGLEELAPHAAVALVPAGWPQADGVVQIPVRPRAALPLVLAWRAGARPPAADRILAALAERPAVRAGRRRP